MLKIWMIVSVLLASSVSFSASTRRILIDCGQGQPKFTGKLTAEFFTHKWFYTCTDLPRQSAFVKLENPLIKIETPTDVYESQADFALSSGFANKVNQSPNSCKIIEAEYLKIGLNALFKRYWHPEFGQQISVSLKDQNAYTSILLMDVEGEPSSALKGTGTILSGNQSCQFTLDQDEGGD